MDYPFVSIIIVNYNGAHYLPTCLDALREQTYRSDRFEVIVSDNGSTDGSLELLRNRYPWVRVLTNQRNLGFASGNNAAIKIAKGKYIVLLNNDTLPSPMWLESLVNVAENNSLAGMVTGRLQLFYDQLVLTFQVEAFVPGDRDTRELGIQIFGVDSGTPGGVYQYLDGFYGWECLPSGRRFRWTGPTAQLGVPVPPGNGEWQVQLELAASRSDSRSVPVKVFMRDTLLAEWSVSGIEPSDYILTLPAISRSLATPLVQNAGSIIFRNGIGRDRGTFVRNHEVFYEADMDQYNQVEEVFAGCGASLLIRKAMLEDVGLLDDDFFMYYEDTDLSWRARLRGWKVFYAPQAIVRHIHCGTSKEWSPFFIYHADRNRLAMLFKNGTLSQVLREWSKYSVRVIASILKVIYAVLRKVDWQTRASQVSIQFHVLGGLLRWLPALWRKRRWIQKSRTVSPVEIAVWFEDDVYARRNL